MTAAPRTPGTVAVPGAVLSFDVVGDLADATPDTPPLVLAGSPMDSTGFGSLAARLDGRVLVLTDPRNTGRSTPDDATAAVTPQQHAEDLHALVAALGVGQVDVFASSGAAVNLLHLLAAHPDDVRILVAHEPPMAGLLPDADAIARACDDMVATYDAAGQGPAMARFIGLVTHRGEVTGDEPAPDPAMFGLPTEDDGSRDDPLMANVRGGGVISVPDLDAVRAAPTRVVVGVGEESGGPDDGEIAGRAAHAVARALGQEPVVFPGGHNGFLGGEFGQTGAPDEFAARLREVLATR
ncbi:alpha/beta fold hydrolase [Nocardioides sp. zg-1228]|uniref:alpha/beta fold hydrolase n=1 Tax=Nocardioides sp. zg-1228 TaxID=2763008 RepID=UPI0016435F1A|nr:alpha/beta hydrolase [Nocardioides sp. zg-1228]MBC2933691.1 alpha/beta hydrolase [Nocardioides sp. zg-1228]QSF58476.1 alpha/beta hydrolase [Nocardioides sp. zg-1228]